MKKTSLVAGVVLLIALVAGTVIWKSTRPAEFENTVVLGTVLPLSGPAAFLGEGTLNGLRLAEEHANAGKWGRLPFRLKVLSEDGAAVPKISIGAFRKLVDVDKARVVVTMASGVSMALKPLAEQEGVLLFANAAHPAITQDARFTLRHSNTAGQESQIITDSILQYKPTTGVAIIYENDDYGSTFAREVQARLGQASVRLLSEQAYDRAGMDARVLAQKAIEGQPDAIVVLGVGKDLGLVIRRLREYGFTGRIYTGLGFVLIPGAAEAAGEHASGVLHTQFNFDVESPDYKQLANEYKTRFGQELGATGLISYNTAKLLCVTANSSQVDPKAVAEKIKGMKEYKGVGERIVISPNGDLMPTIRLTTFEK